MEKIKVGIIGPGNIGTDLMYKVMRSKNLEMKTMTGIVESEGLKRAKGRAFEPQSRGRLGRGRGPEIKIEY
jgi:acetaldehyde dehydrogenase